MNTAQRVASTAKRRRWAADPLSALRVLAMGTSLTPEEALQINLPVRIAYERLRNGAAIEGDFDTVAGAVNVSLVCAESINPFVEMTCIAGRDALVRMKNRHDRLGGWGFDGPGLHEVLDVIEVYEQLTQLLGAGQLKAAMGECIRRMQAGLVETV